MYFDHSLATTASYHAAFLLHERPTPIYIMFTIYRHPSAPILSYHSPPASPAVDTTHSSLRVGTTVDTHISKCPKLPTHRYSIMRQKNCCPLINFHLPAFCVATIYRRPVPDIPSYFGAAYTQPNGYVLFNDSLGSPQRPSSLVFGVHTCSVEHYMFM